MTDRNSKSADKVVPLPRRGRRRAACPICGAPTRHDSRPFCSTRCADIDLGRWLKGGYAIPTDEMAGQEARSDAATDEEH